MTPDADVAHRRSRQCGDAPRKADRCAPEARSGGHPDIVVAGVLAAARECGLPGCEKTAHVSVRVAPALLEAARCQTGIGSPTELIEHALAALVAPDPVAETMKESFGELAVGIAHPDPQAPTLTRARARYQRIVAAIPRSRLLVPDEAVWIEAGVIAGTLARTQNLQPFQRKDRLNDALIFPTAAKVGLPVLTADRDGFDLIQQLAPHGRFVLHEKE